MGYRVVSRFFDRARKVYVDPGAPCPELEAAEAKRLVGAGCVVVVDEESAPTNPLRRRRDASPVPAASSEPPAAAG